MMPFLYFPEDKTEYIPAFISLTIFMLGAVFAMYVFYKKSKKEERQLNERLKQNQKDEDTSKDEQHHK